MKRYEKIEGSDKELKIEVYYDKGGMNYFNGKTDKRGYYVAMRTVSLERRDSGIVVESFGMFSGTKMFLHEVKKQSPKAYSIAVALAEEKIPELREYVLKSAE